MCPSGSAELLTMCMTTSPKFQPVLPWLGVGSQLWAYRAKGAEVLDGLGHGLAKQAHHNAACSGTRVKYICCEWLGLNAAMPVAPLAKRAQACCAMHVMQVGNCWQQSSGSRTLCPMWPGGAAACDNRHACEYLPAGWPSISMSKNTCSGVRQEMGHAASCVQALCSE